MYTKILFICLGNICRSPMAEFVMKDIVQKRGLEDNFHIESAATSRYEIGNDMYPPAKIKLNEKGVSFTRRAARQITPDDYEEFDYLIGMDENNREDIIQAMGGDPDGKVHLLLDFTDSPGEISDPWYTGDFETTYNEVVKGINALLDEEIVM